jgi:hypothetical protein
MALHVPGAAPADGHLHPLRAALEGTLAGVLAATVVVAAYAVTDWWDGDPFRTPVALAALLFGAEAASARGVLLFTGVHVGLWIFAGIASAWAISLADAHPRVWRSVFVALSVAWVSLLYLAGALSLAEMSSLHLWVGAVLGAAAVALVLVWRHPRLLTQAERDRLTDVTRHHLEDVWAFEVDCISAYRTALERFDSNALREVEGRKAQRLASMEAMFARLEIAAPTPASEPVFGGATLVETLRSAIEHEREAVRLYDAFLASTDESGPHDVLLHLRLEAFDLDLPLLEEELRASS